MTSRERPKWRAGLAMLFIASIAAVISYSDGLSVARLAGAGGRVAYLYPLLPDGLIVICLIALYEAARAQVPRPRWATAGLILGAGLTLAQNVGAGAATGVLLAVIDGFVPVVFFVAAEVLIWTIRHGRGTPAVDVSARSVPSGNFEAAKVSMAETAEAGNPWSRNQLQARFGLSRSEADDIWQPYKERTRGGKRPTAPGTQDAPAGDAAAAPRSARTPAGALNGHARKVPG